MNADEKQLIAINSNTLVSVLVLKLVDDIPEPFRCQSSLKLMIDFQEYIKFCRTELGLGYDWLATSTNELTYYIREYDRTKSEIAYKKLFSAFMLDMAYGVLKELEYAEATGQDATEIRHTVYGERIWDDAKLDEYYVNLSGSHKEQELWDSLSHKAIRLKEVSPKNLCHYKYALVAYGISKSGLIWSSK